MAVNKYDRAAEAAFINTYAPIDFGALYQIGAANNAAVEKALKELSTQLKEWGEFQSPSAIDTQRWYDLTLGRGKELIQRMIENPDLLKTAAGRAEIQGFINNTDYSTLSGLKQSRNAMLARQKYNQELALKGLFDPLVHGIDFTNYNTANSGVFNDISPLPYKSIVDMVKPYVDNLEDKYIRTDSKTGLMYHGVTAADTDALLNTNWSSIVTDPHYEQNLQRLIKMGVNPNKAKDVLDSEIYRAGREFTRNRVERDPWWIKQKQREWELSDQAKITGNIKNLTEILTGDGSRMLLETYTNLTPDEMETFEKRGINALPEDKRQQVINATNKDYVASHLRAGYHEIAQSEGVAAGLQWVLDSNKVPLQRVTADIFAAAGTTGRKTADGSYIANDSRAFMLMDEFAWNMMRGTGQSIATDDKGNPVLAFNRNIKLNDEPERRFAKEWKAGNKFHDFLVDTESSMIVGNGKLISPKYIDIPIEQFEDYSEEDLAQIGGTIVTRGANTSTVTERQSDAGINTITTSVGQKEKKYLRIYAGTEIPREGEYANTANAQYNKIRRISSNQVDELEKLSNMYNTY